MLRILFIAILCLSTLDSNAEDIDTVFVGRVISQKYSNVKLHCPENTICMNVWYKWTLKVERVISGSQIRGRIVAFRMQHGDYTKAYLDNLKLFVIRPIKDAETKALLSGEYILVDKSIENKMYCLNQSPTELGLMNVDAYISSEKTSSKYCFPTANLIKKKVKR